MPLRVKSIVPAKDLPPLPQRNAPYPEDVPLDPETVKAALWHGGGNVSRAAALIQTSPARIGRLLAKDTALADERRLAAELMVDQAEAGMLEALADEDDKIRRDEAARFILQHAGKGRGWSKDGGNIALSFNAAGTSGAAQAGTMSIRWESEAPQPPVKQIEGKKL